MCTALMCVTDPDPGSGAFLTPGPGMGKKARSGSVMKKIRIRDKHPGSATLVVMCTYRFDATLVDDSKGAVPDEVLGVELVNPHARRHRCKTEDNLLKMKSRDSLHTA
jgi:hypothetical protein